MDESVGIVGASVAGLALACGLASQGVRCALFDQRPVRQEDPRPALLGPRSLEALARFGLALPVRRAGLSLRRARIRYRGQTLGFLPTSELPSRHPVLASLTLGALRRVLAEKALSTGLVALRPPARVVGVQGAERRVRILLEDGTTASFRFLAAACPDLRRLLGIALLGNQAPLPRWSGEAREAAGDELELFLGASGMALSYPRAGAPPALAAEAWSPQVSRWALREELDLPPGATLEEEPAPLESGYAATLAVGPVVLLGGAARSAPTGAWRARDLDVGEAEGLAWRLAALERGAPQDLLSGYELERRPQSLARAALVPNWLPRLCLPESARLLGPWLRVGFVRRGLGRALSGLSTAYRASSWCRDERPGPRPARPLPGSRLPEARYEDALGRRRWLQDLLGREPLVLRFGEGPPRGGFRVTRRSRGPNLLFDADGSLGKALRGRPGEVLIARPDGVVGYRAWPEDPRRTADWLAALGAS